MTTETQNPQYNGYPTPPLPVQPPKKPSLLKRFGFAAGTLVLAVILGSAVGANAVPEPVEVIKVQEKIVEKTVKVPVTPESCKTALTLAGTVIDYSAEAMGYMSDALQAAGRLDAASITAASEKLNTVTPKLKEIGPKYRAARDLCQAG